MQTYLTGLAVILVSCVVIGCFWAVVEESQGYKEPKAPLFCHIVVWTLIGVPAVCLLLAMPMIIGDAILNN